jgi:hypothetical protein
MITGGFEVVVSTTVMRFRTNCPATKLTSPRWSAFSASVFGIHSSPVPGRAWTLKSTVPRPERVHAGSTSSWSMVGIVRMTNRSRSGSGFSAGRAGRPIVSTASGSAAVPRGAVPFPERKETTYAAPFE